MMMMESIEDTDIRRRSKLDDLKDYINDYICNREFLHDWFNDPRNNNTTYFL